MRSLILDIIGKLHAYSLAGRTSWPIARSLMWIKVATRTLRQHAAMEDRAGNLCRRIALYRRYLEEGVDADVASYYLRQIISAKMELERITDEKRS